MGNTFYFSWEPVLMEWLQLNAGPITQALAKLASLLGGEQLLIAVMGYFYWCVDKQLGIYTGINVAVSLALNPMVKNLTSRRRPYFDHAGVKCLLPVEAGADLYDITAQGYSFPSGHAGHSLAVYGSLAKKASRKAAKIFCYVLVFLIGISRVFVGCHYPTDVLCGWALTGLIFWGLPKLRKAIPDKKKLYLLIFFFAALGCLWCTTSDYYSGLGIIAGMFLGDLFEEKYVRFENTKHPAARVLRLVCGLGLFLGITNLLKLPFSREFLESASAGAFALRVLRYGLGAFTVMGLYPMTFQLFNRRLPKPDGIDKE